LVARFKGRAGRLLAARDETGQDDERQGRENDESFFHGADLPGQRSVQTITPLEKIVKNEQPIHFILKTARAAKRIFLKQIGGIVPKTLSGSF
jgi:hypothetical protein